MSVAANLADRFLATPRAAAARRDCAELQLVVLTALYISLKMRERFRSLDLEDFSVASIGLHSPRDIAVMERKMLRALDWRLCPPTGSQVAHHVLALMLSQEDAKFKLEPGTWDYVRDEVAFQVETAVRDYYFATRRPSTLAAAAILNVINGLGHQEHEYFTAALLRALKAHPFEPYDVLLEARVHLVHLLNEEECCEEEDSISASFRTESAPAEGESQRVWAEEEALFSGHDHSYYDLVQGIANEAQSSPILVSLGDVWDDSSFATM